MIQSAWAITDRWCSMTDHRLAAVHQPVQQAEQLPQVGQVQAGGGLVEHVDAAPMPMFIASSDRGLDGSGLQCGDS
jgi:hypothetical protein